MNMSENIVSRGGYDFQQQLMNTSENVAQFTQFPFRNRQMTPLYSKISPLEIVFSAGGGPKFG